MSKRAELPQSRRSTLIYDEDWEYLSQRFGPHTNQRIGVSAAIRQIVHQRVLSLQARERQIEDSRTKRVA